MNRTFGVRRQASARRRFGSRTRVKSTHTSPRAEAPRRKSGVALSLPAAVNKSAAPQFMVKYASNL
ncbi:MAG TPA: hypothetical protein DCE44_08875 [Verrucomicrobiales bacterium]|nr:hypothetical protein [Verrucomicrobiales bacterium]